MHILLKFDSAKLGSSNLCFSKVIEEKPLGFGSNPSPPVKEGLIKFEILGFATNQGKEST